MSRAEFAALVREQLHPDQQGRNSSAFNLNYLGKLENGRISWPQARYRAALRAVLGVATDEELGFVNPNADSATLDPVKRRDLLGSVGTVIGAGVVGAPMMSLLESGQSTELPKRVGREHVDQVIATADVFQRWDDSHGGELARDIADNQLRRLAQLIHLPCPTSLRAELHTAVAHLASITAWMLFDAYCHDDARRRFTFAFQCAEIGGDWHQRAMLLTNMARQAIWCGRPDNGLTYIEMGLVRADRLTATERAMLHTVRARALAKSGPTHVQGALAAVGAADEAFADSQPADDPSWMRFYDHAQHAGDTAHALYDVAVNTRQPTDAGARFRYSVDHHTPEFARSRAISSTKLASLTMAQGDPHEAAHIGHTALDTAGTVRSRRTADDLRALHRLADHHRSLPTVQALQQRIHEAVLDRGLGHGAAP
ncbi:hypothetical protein [Salinispora arenicola]|uniref:hypothetical protein n=1 Tax=Salinispora arenicola TaxID=168697 RepID=UPI00038070F6|nr:hypothetical protein [Salinispora arenicola]